MHHSEPDQIEKSQNGDIHAFRQLVENNQAFAYAVAFRFTGDRTEAEDITQEAFIKLWKNIKKYRPEIKLRTWLYKIIMNLCFDFLKSARHKQRLKNINIDLSPPIYDEVNNEKQKDDFEMLGVIVRLSKQLTPKQQSVFILRDLEALSVEEVSEITGMEHGQIKSNLYYARLKIREGLTEYYRETKSKLL